MIVGAAAERRVIFALAPLGTIERAGLSSHFHHPTGQSARVFASRGTLLGSSFFSPRGPKCSRTMSSSEGRPSSRWLSNHLCRILSSGISLILSSAITHLPISPHSRRAAHISWAPAVAAALMTVKNPHHGGGRLAHSSRARCNRAARWLFNSLQRFTSQRTRLNSRLKSTQVISGK
jgi:hypothetical protein